MIAFRNSYRWDLESIARVDQASNVIIVHLPWLGVTGCGHQPKSVQLCGHLGLHRFVLRYHEQRLCTDQSTECH